jgi:hypothetical protein
LVVEANILLAVLETWEQLISPEFEMSLGLGWESLIDKTWTATDDPVIR